MNGNLAYPDEAWDELIDGEIASIVAASHSEPESGGRKSTPFCQTICWKA